MQNGLRLALNMAGSFFIAVLLLVVFVFLSLRGAGAPVSVAWFINIFGSHPHARMYREPVLKLILTGLPFTLELLVSSFILAAAAAFAITVLALQAPMRLRWIARNLTLPLRSIPFVWLAAVAALLLAVSTRSEMFGASARPYFDLRDQAAHLFTPSVALALFQIPFLTNARSLPTLIRAFTRALPAILGATVVIEVFFAWPGDGRLFYEGLNFGEPSVATALLLVGACLVLLMRAVVSDV